MRCSSWRIVCKNTFARQTTLLLFENRRWDGPTLYSMLMLMIPIITSVVFGSPFCSRVKSLLYREKSDTLQSNKVINKIYAWIYVIQKKTMLWCLWKFYSFTLWLIRISLFAMHCNVYFVFTLHFHLKKARNTRYTCISLTVQVDWVSIIMHKICEKLISVSSFYS